MEAEFIARMQAEQRELERKLKAVRDLLAAYGAEPAAEPNATIVETSVVEIASANAVAEKKPAASPRPKVGMDGFGDYGRTIIAECMRAMLLTPQMPIKTRRLVEILESKNVGITGDNKINAVGALLSRSIDITSHGKAGWTVNDPHTALEIVGKYARPINEASAADAMDASETALHAQEEGDHRNEPSFLRVAGAATP
ncbi:hypothetical protein [Sphingomonas sp. PR090111-T3T-6A]|uniref:hypothetical protein n=1 Tax=Sphingomonas sp. PR090111-T3T-6A TaxID=685778 RepID=UPI000371CD04|nr:hypothetical protein [Sphingomonas sp. PR090111-T3T-6A]